MKFAAFAALALTASALRLNSGRNLGEESKAETAAWQGYLTASENQNKAEGEYTKARATQMAEESKLAEKVQIMNEQEKKVNEAESAAKEARTALGNAVKDVHDKFTAYFATITAAQYKKFD